MGRSRKSAVRKYHDRVAPIYDHSYDDAYWRWHDALTWDYLKPHIPRDLSAEIIDLGCGTGTWGAKLIKSGYRVTFLDISPAMIDQARQKVETLGGLRRAEFVVADLCDLGSLSAGRYALAVAFGEPIGCSRNAAQALREIKNILHPQGLLSATFDNRLAAIEYYLDNGQPVELRTFLKDGLTHWLTKNEQERFPIQTYAPGELRGLLNGAGFQVVELIGKSVLPMRYHREQLSDPESARAYASIEKSLARDPWAVGRAAHLQVLCRRESET